MVEKQGAPEATPKSDIQMSELRPLSWKTPAEIEASLQALYEFADGTGQNAYAWYMRGKRLKRLFSRGLRVGAIVLATLGGLTPIFLAMAGGAGQAPWLGQVGYLALGLAAGCVVLDKFFGFSSGWMRYITVAQELQAANSQFRFNWNMRWLALNGQVLTPETAAPFIEFIRDYAASVDRSMQQETRLWIAEFQAGLALVDQISKSQVPPAAAEQEPDGKGPGTDGKGPGKKDLPKAALPPSGVTPMRG